MSGGDGQERGSTRTRGTAVRSVTFGAKLETSSVTAARTDSDFSPPSVAAGGVDALVFRSVELVSMTMLVIVTGRLMEPAGRGLYALASLTVLVLILPLGPVWFGNVVEFTRRRVSLVEAFGGSIVIATVGGLGIGAVALAVSPLFGEKWWIVAVPALVTPFLLLTVYQEGLCRGIGHVRAVNLIRIGNAVMPLLFITPPLLAGASPRTAIEIWALAYVVMPLLTYLWLRRFLGPPRLPSDRAFYRRVVTYGVKISGLNAMDTAHWRIGLLALAVVASDAAVGVYSIALAGLGVLFIATQALDLSTFRRIGSDLPEASAALTARTVRHATLITLIGGVILVPVTFLAIPWTVGKGYDDVPILLVMLIPCAICESATNPVYTYFQVQATKPGTLLKVAGSAFLTNVGLTVAFAPRWGIWGVAAAASLAGMVQIGVAQRVFRTEANVRFRDMLPGRREVGDYLALATRMRGRLSRGASSGGGE